MKTNTTFLVLLCSMFVAAAGAQEGAPTGPDFGLGVTIGSQSFPNPDYDGSDDSDQTITYQSLGLQPDIGIGPFGLGLDLTLNYRFTGGSGNEFEVRSEDWVPTEETSFLELYLPKLRYVRWRTKGEPFYVLLGSVDNAVLGNGYILGGYTNTQYVPQQRLFGMSLDLDGALFGFPYVGIETFAGNLAAFDLIGGRLYVRPLAGTEVPIVRNLQLGATIVADRMPFYFAEDNENASIPTLLPAGTDQDEANVVIYGGDVRLPILNNPAVSLATFGDYVFQNESSGAMVGAGGRLFEVVTYGAQIRFVGEDFIPVYFDTSYDLFRPFKYAVYAGVPGFSTDPYLGWFASAGLSLLGDQLVFAANVDGPFGQADAGETFKQPHLLATLAVGEGLLGGFSLEASYDKKGIDDLADLISPEDAVIGARVNYRIENATISLVYDLQHNPFPEPGADQWIVTSKIESAITLF
ncbi:MAG: hypothetical protein ACOC3H_02690 [bacterium]